MEHVHATDYTEATPKPRAFTVLIPRALQPTMNTLPTNIRQQVLAELFRVAALTAQERAGQVHCYTYALRMEVAGCAVSVEMDDLHSRLMLTGLNWKRRDA